MIFPTATTMATDAKTITTASVAISGNSGVGVGDGDALALGGGLELAVAVGEVVGEVVAVNVAVTIPLMSSCVIGLDVSSDVTGWSDSVLVKLRTDCPVASDFKG